MRSPKSPSSLRVQSLANRIYLLLSQRWDKPGTFGPAGTSNKPSAMALDDQQKLAGVCAQLPVDQAPAAHFRKQIGIFGGDRSQPDLSSPPPAHFAADFPAQSFTHTQCRCTAKDCRQTCWHDLLEYIQNDLHITAPIGMPPPKPLALVKTSGSMPGFSYPQNLPLRPMPPALRRTSAKCRFHRKFCGFAESKAISPGRTPPSPCNGSSNRRHP